MADDPPIPANDGFERHYAEKIWALVPEVYRSADGEGDRPGKLRALVEILADQAAIARRSVDRLWSDSRIDEADDWAIPYIGALVGARPVNALNRAAQRANVGRTILYRRRLGTVRLAELLADDIADWDAVASEAFKRLIRHWHMLDGGPQPGPISRSPQWGYADLRCTRVDSILDHAHDDLSHYPDVRRHRGVLGRYNIPKVNLHLFRQYAFPLSGVDVVEIANGLFTLDPSGRDVALFQVGGGAQPVEADSDAALLRLGGSVDECKAAREWEMRAPIPCRRLNFAGFRPRFEDAPVGLEDLLAPIYGRRFATEAGLLEAANAALAEDPTPPNALSNSEASFLIAHAMEDASPRRNLLPGGDLDNLSIAIAAGVPADPPLGPEALYGANLEAWGQDFAPPGWVEALVDPARGRFRVMQPLAQDEAVRVEQIYYGAFWPVGAGTHDRASELATAGFVGIGNLQPDWTGPLSGEFRFLDNHTYRPQLEAGGVIEADGDLTLSAANETRPYVILTPDAGNTVTLRSTRPGAHLVIDGLWIGVFDPAGGGGPTTLRIDGTWARVTLRNVTIDPGGERAAAPAQAAQPIPAVRLAFSGAVDDLVIERCVTGRIVELGTPLDPCATDTVEISDSIVRTPDAADAAIQLRNASLTVDATTVFGDVVVGRIDASELLVDGRVLAEDQQTGCFRFSAAVSGGRTPHPYESHFFDGPLLPFGTFLSKRFGDASYAQLSEIAPTEIRTGGEDGVEIGAFKAALDPIKRDDLAAKLAEFMPLNIIVQQIIETKGRQEAP